MGIPAAPSSLGQGQQHLPLEGPFFMQKYLHIEKKMEEKSTSCSQPFSIPLPAPGEVWIFNSDDLNCIINCCSIPRSNWAAGLIYSQGGWAAEPVVPLHESIKITGSESGVRKATAHFRVSTQTWRGYIQEKILLLPLMTAAFLNL